MDSIENDQMIVFPTKPEIEKKEGGVLKSIGSMLLFIVAFYFVFSQDLTYIISLVAVLLIHELGHFLAMKHFNYKEVKMFFIPLLGALVTGKKQHVSQKQRAIVLLAGPVPGIIIGVLIYVFGNDSLFGIANIFIFLNVFNLLPITPLDGGALLETLFLNTKGILQTIFTILSIVALVVVALYIEAFFLLIVPVFLIIKLIHQAKIKEIKVLLNEKGIDYNKPYVELSNEEYWKIREQVVRNISIFDGINPKDYRPSGKEKQIINQIESFNFGRVTKDLSVFTKTLFLTAWFLAFAIPFLVLAFTFQ